MKSTLTGLAKLTRLNEFGYFILITTLLGVAAAGGGFDQRLALVLLANGLAVGFAYMVNDIEDAPEDAFSGKNKQRNPISSGLISTKTAKTAARVFGLLAVGLYVLLGWWTFTFGMACLLLGILYSHKAIRLKSAALLNMVSRGLLQAGLPFLCAYFAFNTTLNRTWIWPFLFMVFLSFFYDLHDARRADEAERQTRQDRLAALLGYRFAAIMMTAVVILLGSSGIVSFFLISLVPAWVKVTISALFLLFFIPPFLKFRRSQPPELIRGLLFNTLERAAAIGMCLQFLIPWVGQIL
ncbi:MAG: UbiA family prenyltransferase [Brevefilum sp.]